MRAKERSENLGTTNRFYGLPVYRNGSANARARKKLDDELDGVDVVRGGDESLASMRATIWLRPYLTKRVFLES